MQIKQNFKQLALAATVGFTCIIPHANSYAQDKPSIMMTQDGWPALVTAASAEQFTIDGQPQPDKWDLRMAIMCKSPGIVPKVTVSGGAEFRGRYLMPSSVELSGFDMQINDEPWQKVIFAEKIIGIGWTDVINLPGGLILVDRIAKANRVRVKWKEILKTSKDNQITFEVFGEFHTQFETRANPDYVNFLKKKCGVLGLK